MSEPCRIIQGDCRSAILALPDDSVHCCVTSPPYWGMRDYGADGQMGLESELADYVSNLVAVFREVRRVLRRNGTLWLNLGDSYCGARGGAQGRNGHCAGRAVATSGVRISPRKGGSGLKPKDLAGVPWRVALALQADGWFLRSDIVWSKPSAMPESADDRPWRTHEYVFLLSKSRRYYYDGDAVRTPLAPKTATTFGSKRSGQGDGSGLVKSERYGGDVQERKPRVDEEGNPVGAPMRSVWDIASQPLKAAHFAAMPPRLVEPCIKAGSPKKGVVFDPFAGAGTVGLVALRLGRAFLGIEISEKYAELARSRIVSDAPLYNNVTVEKG